MATIATLTVYQLTVNKVPELFPGNKTPDIDSAIPTARTTTSGRPDAAIHQMRMQLAGAHGHPPSGGDLSALLDPGDAVRRVLVFYSLCSVNVRTHVRIHIPSVCMYVSYPAVGGGEERA